MNTNKLFDDAIPDPSAPSAFADVPPQATGHGPRTRVPQRQQLATHYGCLDDLLPPDHPARIVWDVVATLDLSAFTEPIKARQHTPGRDATDPHLLVALWLYACLDNISTGRRLEELCQTHGAYQWLCGGVSVNYHTLNDFRVGHEVALDGLFTQVLGRLMHAGLVQVRRITQDGLRVRASAGTSSFRRKEKLEACLVEAKAHLEDLKRLRDQGESEQPARQTASQQAMAEDRLNRVRQALEAWQQVHNDKQEHQDNAKQRQAPTRASTTDPDARRMKMANGGFNPAYNVQLASDPVSRAIVEVQVTNKGGDAVLSEPMRQQVQQRTSQSVVEQIVDGGYVSLDAIDRAESDGVTIYMPVPQRQKEGQDRFVPRPRDSAAVAHWRVRMGTPEAQGIYQQRSSTSETVNADLRTWRGLSRFMVRGLRKVQCVALWSALMYNVMHFAGRLLG